MRKLSMLTAHVLVLTAFMAWVPGSAGNAQRTRQAPLFQVEPNWLKLPNNWVVDVVTAVDVDRNDNVWVLHRGDVKEELKNRVAPNVLEFDSTGKFLQAWGGPSTTKYDWPDREHAIYVDDKDNVWLAGTGSRGTPRSDDFILKLTMKGDLVMKIGARGRNTGVKDTVNPNGAADLFLYPKTNELFAGDEGNLRLMVFDAETGAFKRMWGAFGKAPAMTLEDVPPAAKTLDTEGDGPSYWRHTHSSRVSNDGLVYVADRGNRRVQIFTIDGKYVTQLFINRSGPAADSASGIEFSPDPEQRFMYVSDFGNQHIVVVERKTLEVLYQFGEKGDKPGDFQGVHYMAVDSKGNLYAAEVAPGNRLQKFVFKGLGTPPPGK